jgi:hypothetical protein
MEIFASAATWVGAGSMAAVAGWAFGRWHGLIGQTATLTDRLPRIASASAAHEPVSAAVRAVGTALADQADNAISLCDLHDQVTALRHREQILATLAPEALMMDQTSAAEAEGPIDTNPAAPDSDVRNDCPRLVSAPLKCGSPAQREAADQPSPGASPFTRV